jgi:Uma2 family endonuclease
MNPTLLTADIPIPAPPDSDSLYEVIDGQRVEKPVGAYEISLANILQQFLGPFATQHNLGRVVIEMPFDFPSLNRQRLPDVAFVSYQRWPRTRRVPRSEAWEVVPDLAVEVVSPSNKAEDVIAKMHEYFRVGVRCVWIVWPTTEQVYRYTSPTEVRIFSRSETIDGGDIVPGFRLPLTQLFEEETEPAPPNGQSPGAPGSSEQ